MLGFTGLAIAVAGGSVELPSLVAYPAVGFITGNIWGIYQSYSAR